MTKGAQVGFTRSLAENLADRQIRVNEVAPGSFWTPLQPATGWPDEKIISFGVDAPMGPGEPADIAPTCLSIWPAMTPGYVTGQTLHVNGGVYCG